MIFQVCKDFSRLTRTKQLWIDRLCCDVLHRGIAVPPYHQPLESLSGHECETLVLHALTLRHNLSSLKSPSISTFNQAMSISWVKLVAGQWILAACSDQSKSVLRLWSLEDVAQKNPNLFPIAEAYLEGPVYNGLAEIQEGTIIIVLELRPKLYVFPSLFLTSGWHG